MEWVEGQPIDQFCDQYQLSVHERLVLACRLCDAIEHAHQRGVLHRDIKPGNVIASKMGNRTKLKVIDFGIAKAIGNNLIAHDAAETKVGQIIGTPAYMSPEQADLRNAEIDQRSDVYSIGVLIYKLLTGTTPLQPTWLEGKSLTEVLQVISNFEAERPSSRLRRLDANSRSVLATRLSTDSTVHHQRLRSELDWLVLKAIHVDRRSRYASADELGNDIRRYLDHKPIAAISSSYGYQIRKFYRRNRTTCLTTMVVILATLAYVLSYSQFRHQQKSANAAVQQELDSLTTSIAKAREAAPATTAEAFDFWNSIETNAIRAMELSQQPGISRTGRNLTTTLADQISADRECFELCQQFREAANRCSIFHGGTLTLSDPTDAKFSDQQVIAETQRSPNLFHPLLLEALTLRMANCPRGLGFDLGRNQAGLFIKTLYRDGVAANSSKLTVGQRLVAIPKVTQELGLSLTDLPTSRIAQFLNGIPSASRTLVVESNGTTRKISLMCGSEASLELVHAMNRIDGDPWRTRLRTAVQEFDEAELLRLASAPELVQQPLHSYILLAVGMRQLSLEKEKVSVLRAAQARFPQQALSHLALAEALALESQPRMLQEAARYLTATVAVDADNLVAQFLLARVLHEQHKTEEAKRQYELIIERNPQAVAPKAYYVSLLQSEGRRQEANTVYRSMLAQHGNKAEVGGMIKQVHQQQIRRNEIPELSQQVSNRINAKLLRDMQDQDIPLPNAGKLKSQMGDLIRALSR